VGNKFSQNLTVIGIISDPKMHRKKLNIHI